MLLVLKHYILLQYLASGVVPLELPTPCMNLRTLYLEIDFNDLKQISVVLCLLKSSPNIQKLALSVSTHLALFDLFYFMHTVFTY